MELRYGVMVSTRDFGSRSLGSNPNTSTKISLGGEMADTRDLKSLGQKCPCEFESHPRHFQ